MLFIPCVICEYNEIDTMIPVPHSLQWNIQQWIDPLRIHNKLDCLDILPDNRPLYDIEVIHLDIHYHHRDIAGYSPLLEGVGGKNQDRSNWRIHLLHWGIW